jgi:hypothetical protein
MRPALTFLTCSSLCFAAAAPACSGDSGHADDALDASDTSPAADTGVADTGVAVVRLQINDFGTEGYYTTVKATLATAAQPTVHAVDTEAGNCRLLVSVQALCEPSCVYPELCTAQGTCQAFPEPLSAGALTLTDGVDALTVPFDGYGYWLQSAGLPFAPGETVTVSAPGDAFPAFSAVAAMPDVLVAPGIYDVRLTTPGDLLFTWDPPTAGAPPAHVRITLNAGYGHGLPLAAVVECDVPDTGSFAVPDALRAALPPPSTWGCGECPESYLTRYRKVTVEAGDTALDLIVESPLRFYTAYPN